MRESNHKLTLLPFPPRNDLSLLVEFIPFLNKNADPFSTTTSMSFLESKLTKTAKSQPSRSWLKKKKGTFKTSSKSQTFSNTYFNYPNRSGRSRAKHKQALAERTNSTGKSSNTEKASSSSSGETTPIARSKYPPDRRLSTSFDHSSHGCETLELAANPPFGSARSSLTSTCVWICSEARIEKPNPSLVRGLAAKLRSWGAEEMRARETLEWRERRRERRGRGELRDIRRDWDLDAIRNIERRRGMRGYGVLGELGF